MVARTRDRLLGTPTHRYSVSPSTDRPPRTPFSNALAFTVGQLILGSLLLALAAAWARWRALPLASGLLPTSAGLAAGLAASLPACGALLVLAGPRARRMPGVSRLQETFALIRNLLSPVAWWQILLIAGMAGLSEEVLFRGVVQAEMGLVAAAVLFGLCHPFSTGYVVYAALLGLYLGLVAKASGGLVAPVVAHAVYDAVGLWYLTRRWAPQEASGLEESSLV